MALQKSLSLNAIVADAESAGRQANALADSMLSKVMQFDQKERPSLKGVANPTAGAEAAAKAAEEAARELRRLYNLTQGEAEETVSMLQRSNSLPPEQKSYFDTFLQDNFRTPEELA